MPIIKMGIAGCRAHISMAEQLTDHRQRFRMRGGMAGKAVPQVVDADAGKACFIAQLAPQAADIRDWTLGCRVPEHIALLFPARQGVQDSRGSFCQPDRAWPGFAVCQQQAPSPHLAPLETGYLRFATASQDQQADRSAMERKGLAVAVEHFADPFELLI